MRTGLFLSWDQDAVASEIFDKISPQGWVTAYELRMGYVIRAENKCFLGLAAQEGTPEPALFCDLPIGQRGRTLIGFAWVCEPPYTPGVPSLTNRQVLEEIRKVVEDWNREQEK